MLGNLYQCIDVKQKCIDVKQKFTDINVPNQQEFYECQHAMFCSSCPGKHSSRQNNILVLMKLTF